MPNSNSNPNAPENRTEQELVTSYLEFTHSVYRSLFDPTVLESVGLSKTHAKAPTRAAMDLLLGNSIYLRAFVGNIDGDTGPASLLNLSRRGLRDVRKKRNHGERPISHGEIYKVIKHPEWSHDDFFPQKVSIYPNPADLQVTPVTDASMFEVRRIGKEVVNAPEQVIEVIDFRLIRPSVLPCIANLLLPLDEWVAHYGDSNPPKDLLLDGRIALDAPLVVCVPKVDCFADDAFILPGFSEWKSQFLNLPARV